MNSLPEVNRHEKYNTVCHGVLGRVGCCKTDQQYRDFPGKGCKEELKVKLSIFHGTTLKHIHIRLEKSLCI